MSSTQLRRLNLLPDIRTVNGIQNIINYINSNFVILPPNLDNRQRHKFILNYNNGNWRVINNTLHYNPPTQGQQQGRINLQVIPPNPVLKNQLMTQLYNNIDDGVGIGLNQFYSLVSKHYLGFTRKETTEFLKKQGNYQITRPIKKVLNHPILALCANERWQVDIIHVIRYATPQYNNAGHNRYILTVVDVFSKYIFARPLLNEQSITTTNALNNIIQTNNTIPRLIQTDNGASFGIPFITYLNNNHITHLLSRSNTPTQNSVIERFNAEIRKKIRALNVKHNNLEWSNFLQNICNNINNQKSSSTGFTPNELWRPGYNPPPNHPNYHIQINDNSSLNDIQQYAMIKQLRRATTNIINQHVQNFNIGDQVRVKIESVYAPMRQRNKDKSDVKYNAITYTPQIFQITRVIRGNIPQPPLLPNQNLTDVRNAKYTISNLQGQPVLTPNNQPKEFYSSDLIHVPVNSTPINQNIDFNRMLFLNRF